MRIFMLLSLYFPAVFAAGGSQIWDSGRVANISTYGQAETYKLGQWFTFLQNEYFAKIFLIILIAVPALFALHFMVIGPMRFSHEGKKIFTFSLFNRIVHWTAAVAFLMLVPTGFIIMFGKTFGGGTFVLFARYIHDVGTVVFTLAVLPMFFMWVTRMIIAFDDFKWLLIFGGYLSKKKKPIPAGKFNSGQKTWFWLATCGGIIMILTGAAMFFMDFDSTPLQDLTGLSHIDILRLSAMIHNILGMAMVILFFVHLYMSLFAIKGAVSSMLTGYKHEEEVKIMHSSWYRELKEKGKV